MNKMYEPIASSGLCPFSFQKFAQRPRREYVPNKQETTYVLFVNEQFSKC